MLVPFSHGTDLENRPVEHIRVAAGNFLDTMAFETLSIMDWSCSAIVANIHKFLYRFTLDH